MVEDHYPGIPAPRVHVERTIDRVNIEARLKRVHRVDVHRNLYTGAPA